MKNIGEFFLGAALVVAIIVLGFTVAATGHKTVSVTGITESIHITAADGVKSIGQLIKEQGQQIPNQAISKFHFIVDAEGDTLIFPRVEPFQPVGFQWSILPGNDIEISIPEIELKGEAALDLFLVKTRGTTNVLMVIEFYPNRR